MKLISNFKLINIKANGLKNLKDKNENSESSLSPCFSWPVSEYFLSKQNVHKSSVFREDSSRVSNNFYQREWYQLNKSFLYWVIDY